MTWYYKVTSDISNLPAFIQHYEDELANARGDVIIRGNVEKNISALPGITEQRFNQLQEIEAVLRWMEIQLRQIRRKHFQKYLEAYNKVLSSRDAEKYTDGEQEVVDYECLANEVALIRNKYLGVMKSLESKNFMLSNLVRLKCAGMESFSI